MGKSQLTNKFLLDLKNLAAQEAGYRELEIVELNVLAHTKPMTIQVQIRQKDGNDVSLEDCAAFSAPMGIALEESNLVKDPYLLEISSPGLGEILKSDKEFETFKGFPIEVIFKNKDNLESIKTGLLQERTKEHLIINMKGRLSKIARSQLVKVRLISPTS